MGAFRRRVRARKSEGTVPIFSKAGAEDAIGPETNQPESSSRPVLLIALLDVPEAEHGKILDHLLGQFAASHKLVFLLSTDVFTPFLRHQLAIETFPSHHQQFVHRALMDWPSYLAEKWQLLLLKWRPETILSYGTNPDRFIEQARAALAVEESSGQGQ